MALFQDQVGMGFCRQPPLSEMVHLRTELVACSHLKKEYTY